MDGKIIKGIGGFYYIHAEDDRVYSCRAVGIFRKTGIKPLVGDDVSFEITDPSCLEGSLSGIKERRNVLIRPAAANIDQALLVFAVREPDPSLGLMDRFLIYMGAQDIPVTIYFNKADLGKEGELGRYMRIYEDAGYRVLAGSTGNDADVAKVRDVLKGSTTVLAGPSGAGKSSLTNRLCLKKCMEVGSLSKKLKRGRQTTRHTELFMLDPESHVLDTPGFSSIFLKDIKSGELEAYFPELASHAEKCRFTGCSHVNEDEAFCAVKKAVSTGSVSMERYLSYCRIYRELKEMEKR